MLKKCNNKEKSKIFTLRTPVFNGTKTKHMAVLFTRNGTKYVTEISKFGKTKKPRIVKFSKWKCDNPSYTIESRGKSLPIKTIIERFNNVKDKIYFLPTFNCQTYEHYIITGEYSLITEGTIDIAFSLFTGIFSYYSSGSLLYALIRSIDDLVEETA